MSLPGRCAVLALSLAPTAALADSLLYAYECNVVPLDPSTGWVAGNRCEGPCSESVEDGHFVLQWTDAGDTVNYHYWIAQPPEDPPLALWVEWRFRSNHPISPFFYTCDGRFTVKYGGIFELVFMFGDAAVSFSGGDAVFGLEIDEFHTYRFDSLDGINYRISVDGLVFITDVDDDPNGYHYLQFGGDGGCDPELFPTFNEWDMIRFGTIDSGERIIAADPPGGFLDPGLYPTLDRFAVTFDSANYVYIDEITVETSGGITPTVVKTWRRENDEPNTLEIVLDQPIPLGEHTRFIFNDGTTTNVVDYTYVLGDANGDGGINLSDVAVLQRCFGKSNPTARCRAFDFNNDQTIDLTDYAMLASILDDPSRSRPSTSERSATRH